MNAAKQPPLPHLGQIAKAFSFSSVKNPNRAAKLPQIKSK
jgi:hypothetical protein